MQGVHASTGESAQSSVSDVFGDAILVSRRQARSSKLHSLSDESDLAAGRKNGKEEDARFAHEEYTASSSFAEQTTDDGRTDQWQPRRVDKRVGLSSTPGLAMPPASGLSSEAHGAAAAAAAAPPSASCAPPEATSSEANAALFATSVPLPGVATSCLGSISAPQDGAQTGHERSHSTGSGGGPLAAGQSSVPLVSTSSAPVVSAHGPGKGRAAGTDVVAERERQLLAQIKELTRQLDKEKHRKKAAAASQQVSKEKRTRLVICSQLLPYKIALDSDGVPRVAEASGKQRAYSTLTRLDVTWVSHAHATCPMRLLHAHLQA